MANIISTITSSYTLDSSLLTNYIISSRIIEAIIELESYIIVSNDDFIIVTSDDFIIETNG